MTTYRHTLADVIECSWWPNAGPVFIRPRARPYDDELVVPEVHVKRENQVTLRARVIAVLREAEAAMSSYGIACALVGSTAAPTKQVVSCMASMHQAGIVKRIQDRTGQARVKWMLVESEEAAA